MLALSLASTPEGLAFLAANKEKEGVVTLPSGLQYKVITSGPEGGLSPKVNSPCDCHYRGYLMDGVTEFDSSYKRGTTTKFAPNQVIKGWTEAMQLMKEVSGAHLIIKISNISFISFSISSQISPHWSNSPLGHCFFLAGRQVAVVHSF